MHRSASWNRVVDEYFIHSSPKAPTGLRMTSNSMDENGLPEYDPIIETAKKEKSRIKFAENAVHVIPFVLLFCGFILWFFSNPDIEVGIKTDSVAARVEGLRIEGDIDTDSDGTQTGFLPMDLRDLDAPIKQTIDHHTIRKLATKS